jgi:pimeloyl-ACP methyl ester carboxylesterase
VHGTSVGPVRVHAGSRSHASARARRSETSEVNHRFVETNDQRGYGGTDRPDQVERYTQLHLIGDVIGLLNALDEEQAVVVGHDWGAPIAWNTLLRPNRVRGVVGLSMPYLLVARWSAAQAPTVHDVSITLPLRFCYGSSLYFKEKTIGVL